MMKTDTKIQCWDVERSTPFADISAWCLKNRDVNRLMVAVRPYLDAHDQRSFDPQIGRSVATIFGDKVIRMTPAAGWPGTQLIGHTGQAYTITFDEVVRERMIATQKYLSGWKQSNDPPLPEDVCLYREGEDWPVLVSVTHDGDAWLFDDKPDAKFVRAPEIPLPNDLVPPPPDFILQQVRVK